MREIWKDVVGYEGLYQVSDFGNVRVTHSGRIVKPGLMAYEYFGVGLFKNGIRKTSLVHRLVAMAFIKNTRDEAKVVNHIDSNALNNHVSNLEWCTQYENIHHCMDAGRARPSLAQENGRSKLKNKDVPKIFKMRTNGMSQREIARKYSVSGSCISYVLSRKTYKSVPI